ncbi:MAG: methionyl-tRNA formyltransferase, partial [Mycoplasmatales bacterium]
MKKTRIVFMGTPVFAAHILKKLVEENYNIVGVVTQPDKKVGRKRELKPTPVKEVANQNNIQVFQPIKITTDYEFLEQVEPELIITAAYGQFIPNAVIDYPKLGCIKVHGSLLPKYRGGAPIHYAILNGETKTGVTIMEMIAKMDAGNIISQQEFEIKFEDTLGIVHDNMVEVAKELLLKTLPKIINQTNQSLVQNEAEV